MLAELNLNACYNRLEDNIADAFYLPCMDRAFRYDRISGYFGSTVYIIAWSSLKSFIERGGKIRVLCSPYISEDDANAIERGISARTNKLLQEALLRELKGMLAQEDLSVPSKLLACLIASDILQIKLVIGVSDEHPEVKKLFHDKAGVFYDEAENMVAFRGSFNETFKGLSDDGNVESVDVFQSWDGGKELDRVLSIRTIFDKVWRGEYSTITAYELPQEVSEFIKKEASAYKWQELLEEIQITKRSTDKWNPTPSSHEIKLRKHQTKALDGWAANNYRALYQGCTGCGKTIIAIAAIRQQLLAGKAVLVVVPSKILLTHWQKEIMRLLSDLDPRILLCGGGNTTWKTDLQRFTYSSHTRHRVTIAVIDTATSEHFINRLSQGNHLFVVVDEVHRIGSESRRKFLELVNAGSRLGLSATPKRYNDPVGTQAIIDYFGQILQPPYTLKDALRDNVLTHYFYRPERIELTEQEQEDWDKISKEISQYYAIHHNDEEDNGRFLQNMAIKRARILKKAANKLTKALQIIQDEYKDGQKWLVYCEDIDQLQQMNSMLQAVNFNSYVYYAEMSGDRDETLEYFRLNGGILVSIKCLDEGVDIPATTHALILASSKNPREFIQRRGRVLRKAKGKYLSYLYDVIVVPNMTNAKNDKSMSIVTSELARAIEFGITAENPGCITKLKIIANDFGIDYGSEIEGGFEQDET